MDLSSHKLYAHESQTLSPFTNSPTSPLHSSHNNFAIIAAAIIGIFAITILLLSYYIFVTKCFFNLHQINILTRFSVSRRQHFEDLSTFYSPEVEKRGLDEAAIRSIPIFQYRNGIGKDKLAEGSYTDCVVCLNEFQEDEKLRIIPNCGHVFHIDCLDIWLQKNTNCPLCRTSISSTKMIPLWDQILPLNTPPQDCIVIEINELSSISPSPRKLEPKIHRKASRKLSHVSSMGDECINSRKKEEQFRVEPIRRSFSMDSAADRQLYLSIQQIIKQQSEVADEGCSSRVKRSFFSFGQRWASRNTVLTLDQ
ncbi:RING-H2 finger ATL16-like [Olea europaea subsp. europaea]|uniref:RING-type E3 ubiquitin transferase n=1 Tax=Olea europaea subsp. europaea TaxID=158383 RepID=A0A8S0TWK8_OLEEU|nr:RING-H2 finger ATL16-like [Olea europaea subsp. europaea]